MWGSRQQGEEALDVRNVKHGDPPSRSLKVQDVAVERTWRTGTPRPQPDALSVGPDGWRPGSLDQSMALSKAGMGGGGDGYLAVVMRGVAIGLQIDVMMIG